MTSENLSLDPEFEAILREMASKPGSVLLRAARPGVLRSLYAREEVIRPSATELDAVERELLAVHRSETAWLLRQVCLHKLLANELSPRILNRYATSREYRVADAAEIARRRDELGDESGLRAARATEAGAAPRVAPNERLQEASRLIGEFVRAPRASSPSVLALATLSLRLEPTNQGRLLAAIDLVQRGSPQTAIRLALDVLDSHPTNEHAARAWECIAASHVKLGSKADAYRANCHGTRQVDAPFLMLMNRVLFAAQFGLEKDVIESARRLDEFLRPDHPALECFVSSQFESRERKDWTPSPEAVALANRVGDKVNPVAGRILNVFT